MPTQVWEAASYLVAISGSILLWVSYALIGLIAKRYSQVFGRITYSTMIMLAPSGLLLYTLFLIFRATPLLDNPQIGEVAQWVAYLGLLGSGLFCLLGIARFARVLKQVTEIRPERPGSPNAA